MKPLILIGGGGHCLSVIDAAHSAGFEIAGILDPAAAPGYKIGSCTIIGNDDDIATLAASGNYEFVVTLGSIKNPTKRIALQNIVEENGGIMATIVASTTHVSQSATIGRGTVVLHKAVVNAGACIGDGCIINTGAIVEHSAKIGNYTHVSTAAVVNGDVCIAAGSFIGSGAILSSQIKITAPAVIGAGAVVLTDIKKKGIYVGVPAKFIREL